MAAIVLINIFLTLIINAFETVKHDVQKQNNEYEIMDFLIKKVKAMFGLANTADLNSGALDSKDSQNTIEEQLILFPDKIDRLLHYINDTYFDGKLDVNQKNAIKRMGLTNRARVTPTPNVTAANERHQRRGARGRRSQPNLALLAQPRVTILDWMEVGEQEWTID